MTESIHFRENSSDPEKRIEGFQRFLEDFRIPYKKGDTVGIKLHWGEHGNQGFLPPLYAAEVVAWLKEKGIHPYVFDTTVLYSGGRRDGMESLRTASRHGYNEDYLGCPCVIGDGLDGRDTIDIAASFKHFETVQVASVVNKSDGFFILSHFTGHMASGFGASIKNISMGFASRAQKQRMHADAHPRLIKKLCTRCGLCVDCCPVQAGSMARNDYPSYNLDRCVGCALCIGLCPVAALDLFWNCNPSDFQERLVETAAAVWRLAGPRTLCANILLSMTADCDCLPGKSPVIREDIGFIGGYHPLSVDEASIERVGHEIIDRTHPGIPWRRQFSYAREIGFNENP
ncbi:MAG: DUF362 domain-containing protein [Syntrophales bacterium]|nr:DUF362 domain-containing protein [Syntrophales bacterium]